MRCLLLCSIGAEGEHTLVRFEGVIRQSSRRDSVPVSAILRLPQLQLARDI